MFLIPERLVLSTDFIASGSVSRIYIASDPSYIHLKI